jgi:hypothetical protein
LSSSPIKRRSPYISKAGTGSSSYNNSNRKKYTFCNHCGGNTVYWPQYHGLWCNHCGTLEEDSDELNAQLELEQMEQQSTFSLSDGTDVYSPEAYTYSKLRNSSRNTGRRTIFPVGAGRRQDLITDKLRMRDGRSREMDAIFKAQDDQLTSTGRTITGDRLELRRSSNITSSEELRAEKGEGSFDLSNTGRYNPATGSRRTRFSF